MEAFTEYMHSYMRSTDETSAGRIVPPDTRDYCVVEDGTRILYVVPISARDWLIYASDSDGRVSPRPLDDERITPDEWHKYKRVLDWCFVNRDDDFVLEFLEVPFRHVIYYTVKHLAIAAPEKLALYAAALIHDLTSPRSRHHGCLHTEYFLQLLHHVPIADPVLYHGMVANALYIGNSSYQGYIVEELARQKDWYIERAFDYLRNLPERERAATARLYGLILEKSRLPNYEEYRALIGNPNVPPASVLAARLVSRTL